MAKVKVMVLKPLSPIFQLQCILLWSVLLVEESRLTRKATNLLQVTDKLDHIMLHHIKIVHICPTYFQFNINYEKIHVYFLDTFCFFTLHTCFMQREKKHQDELKSAALQINLNNSEK
jgi:hypothetical protein